MTARVQTDFLSFFSGFLDFCLLFLVFLLVLTWRASMFGLLGASVEVVRVRASTYGARNRTAALLDRETGPDSDLTWQWTLAVVVCAALAGVLRNVSTKLN